MPVLSAAGRGGSKAGDIDRVADPKRFFTPRPASPAVPQMISAQGLPPHTRFHDHQLPLQLPAQRGFGPGLVGPVADQGQTGVLGGGRWGGLESGLAVTNPVPLRSPQSNFQDRAGLAPSSFVVAARDSLKNTMEPGKRECSPLIFAPRI